MIETNAYYVAGLPFSCELYHHGIKGQKWYIRRFQNPDGTLTTAGKIRYGVGNALRRVGKATKDASKDLKEKKHQNYIKKHPEKMTDEELSSALKRIQLEKQYKDILNNMPKSKKQQISDAMLDTFKSEIKTIGGAVATKVGQKVAEKIFSDKELDALKRAKEIATLASDVRKLKEDKGLDELKRKKEVASLNEEIRKLTGEGELHGDIDDETLNRSSDRQLEAYKNRLIDMKQARRLRDEVNGTNPLDNENTDSYKKTDRFNSNKEKNKNNQNSNGGGKNKNNQSGNQQTSNDQSYTYMTPTESAKKAINYMLNNAARSSGWNSKRSADFDPEFITITNKGGVFTLPIKEMNITSAERKEIIDKMMKGIKYK